MKEYITTILFAFVCCAHFVAMADVPSNFVACKSHHEKIDASSSIDEELQILEEQNQCLIHFKYAPSGPGTTSQTQTIQGQDATGNPISFTLTTPQSQANRGEESAANLSLNEKRLANAQGKRQFLGQNFGYGFGISFYEDTVIDDAAVVNGVVRVKSKKREEARVLLEFHSILFPSTGNNFGHGPFAALVASEDDLLSGVGIGWLWSFKDKTKSDGSAFSIGIGYLVDNDVRSLAGGFKDGAALPAGESDVRFVSEPRESYLLFLTNNF